MYSDAEYTVQAWRTEVGQGRETQGYIDWVIAEYHADRRSAPPALARVWQTMATPGLDLYGVALVHPDDRDDFSRARWEDAVVAGQTMVGYEAWLAEQAALPSSLISRSVVPRLALAMAA